MTTDIWLKQNCRTEPHHTQGNKRRRGEVTQKTEVKEHCDAATAALRSTPAASQDMSFKKNDTWLYITHEV